MWRMSPKYANDSIEYNIMLYHTQKSTTDLIVLSYLHERMRDTISQDGFRGLGDYLFNELHYTIRCYCQAGLVSIHLYTISVKLIVIPLYATHIIMIHAHYCRLSYVIN